MIKNYLKIAWRNIVRKKIYTVINVLGLTLGLCATVIIYLIVSYELSFDTFHADNDRIYRVIGDLTESTGDKLHFIRVPLPVSQTIRTEVSGVENVTVIMPFDAKIRIVESNQTIKNFDSKKTGTNFITTAILESPYFDIFKFDWLAGNTATALNEPFSVVLTESKAHQYFGSESLDKIIGKQVIYQDSLVVRVTGIVKDWDKNTDLVFTDFISFNTLQSSFLKNKINTHAWTQRDMNTWAFVKLKKDVSTTNINAQMKSLLNAHADSQINLALRLEPISDIHFNSDIIENPIRTAHKPTLYGLMGIALFILILAVINFINLSTAQSIQRAKEISIRKVLGSSRSSLIFQYLTETFMLTAIAVLLAIMLVNPMLSSFSSFIPQGVFFNIIDPYTLIFLLFITLITSILAGIYPAIVLSAHLPAQSLKGSGTEKGGEKWLLRKGLIVFQFAVSLIFIISSFVIANQLKYTREKDLGFKSDAIISLESPRGENASKLDVLKDKIKQLSEIKNVAKQWQAPMHDNPRGMKLKLKSTDIKDFWVKQIAGNEDFIPLYEMKLIAGRNLVKTDTVNEFVINENLANLIGAETPEKAIGQVLYWNDQPYPIVGVVADFHTQSLHELISPLCIINRPDRENALAIKLSSNGKQSATIATTLSKIEKIWKELYPDKTFSVKFLDESLVLLYQKDQQTATLMNTSMLIAIFISCIGLFGLILFSSTKRAKEISIRKILGASVANIALLLSKDYVVLVVISLFIASPIAWYFMNQWLQNFAYHILVSWWIFILAGCSALLIVFITIFFQAIKAAVANPVKSLRTE